MRIILVGPGNVATHLAAAIADSPHRLIQVLSRSRERARLLAGPYNAEAIEQVDELDATADIIILAVKDEVLESDFLEKFPDTGSIICHTSGTVSMDVLSNFKNHGIFYPLQTFSKKKPLDFSKVPLCLEASSEDVLKKLHLLAGDLSGKVYELDSAQRKSLHIAAVFACNFSNLMYDIAQKLVEHSELDFDILRPLIAETADKVQEHLPAEVQTGPAARNDRKTINRHLQALKEFPDYQEIYRILSDEILQQNHKNT